MNVSGAREHWALMPPGLARRSGARVIRVGDGLLTMLPTSDMLRMNRLVGLGRSRPARPSMIDAAVALGREAGVASLSVLPAAGPRQARIMGWLTRRGFRRKGGHVVLVRDLRELPRVEAGVRVARMRRDQGEAVLRVHEDAFGPPPAAQREWTRAAVAAPGYEHYLAFVGRTPVAAGSLRVVGRLAWLGGGATRTRWRRRGAHAAVIAARLRRAARRGCAWAWVETAIPARGRPQGSLRNLLRLGFQVVAERPAYVLKIRR